MKHYSKQPIGMFFFTQADRQTFGWFFTGSLIFIVLLFITFAAYAATVNYSYDQAGRLTEATFNNNEKKISYTYDNAGNMILKEIIADITTDQDIFILTDTTPEALITAGRTARVHGTRGANYITLESGAEAELINFPGNNIVTIHSDSSLFTISRSGAAVTFEGSDGTVLKMPATALIQMIIFNDKNLELVIDSNQVMLGSQVITFEKLKLSA